MYYNKCQTCLTLKTSEKNPLPILCMWKSSKRKRSETACRTAMHDGTEKTFLSSRPPVVGNIPDHQGVEPLSSSSPRAGLNFCIVFGFFLDLFDFKHVLVKCQILEEMMIHFSLKRVFTSFFDNEEWMSFFQVLISKLLKIDHVKLLLTSLQFELSLTRFL